jgi:hypothetical protein
MSIGNNNVINITNTDNSTGKITGNIIKDSSFTIESNKHVIKSLSNEEWVELTKYFGDKQFSSDDKDIKYQAKYEMAEQMAKKKNMAGLRAIIGKASSEFAKILCSEGAKIGIKAILDKVIV